MNNEKRMNWKRKIWVEADGSVREIAFLGFDGSGWIKYYPLMDNEPVVGSGVICTEFNTTREFLFDDISEALSMSHKIKLEVVKETLIYKKKLLSNVRADKSRAYEDFVARIESLYSSELAYKKEIETLEGVVRELTFIVNK